MQSFRNKKSFTLIELIITIVVVGIVAFPISITLAKQVQSVFVSQDYIFATNLARLDMDTSLNTAYASLVSASFTNYKGYPYNLTRTVVYVPPSTALTGESLKSITVSVTKSGSTIILITLVSYVAKNITIGL
ncbi:MAG: prepilin-type N-terminal cleavage/methylation domain-containing protein [Candidatus Omnitrophota bacterium]